MSEMREEVGDVMDDKIETELDTMNTKINKQMAAFF